MTSDISTSGNYYSRPSLLKLAKHHFDNISKQEAPQLKVYPLPDVPPPQCVTHKCVTIDLKVLSSGEALPGSII